MFTRRTTDRLTGRQPPVGRRSVARPPAGPELGRRRWARAGVRSPALHGGESECGRPLRGSTQHASSRAPCGTPPRKEKAMADTAADLFLDRLRPHLAQVVQLAMREQRAAAASR